MMSCPIYAAFRARMITSVSLALASLQRTSPPDDVQITPLQFAASSDRRMMCWIFNWERRRVEGVRIDRLIGLVRFI